MMIVLAVGRSYYSANFYLVKVDNGNIKKEVKYLNNNVIDVFLVYLLLTLNICF